MTLPGLEVEKIQLCVTAASSRLPYRWATPDCRNKTGRTGSIALPGLEVEKIQLCVTAASSRLPYRWATPDCRNKTGRAGSMTLQRVISNPWLSSDMANLQVSSRNLLERDLG